MTTLNLLVQPPNPGFRAINGTPIEDGKIYIGEDGLDAQENPVIAYWNEQLTQVATQPVRTLGGYPSNNGVVGSLYVGNNYSVKVLNKDDTLVSSITNGGPSDIIIGDLSTVAGISTEVTIVANIDTDVTNVSNISTDVIAVSANNTSITTCASNISSIIAAPTEASNAAASAASADADAISTAADVVAITALIGATGTGAVIDFGDRITGTAIFDYGFRV